MVDKLVHPIQRRGKKYFEERVLVVRSDVFGGF